MNYTGAKQLVAQKSGLTLVQNETLIGIAILAALEETGVHLTIAKALKDKTMTIAASKNYITWSTEYSRLVSVVYLYSPSGTDYRRPLTNVSPTEFEFKNAGAQFQVSDLISFYTPRGDRIYVGPGNTQTGGSLIVQYQRKLVPEDIEDLPNSSMIVWGALGNLLPVDNPEQGVFRRMFIRELAPAAEVASPSIEQHDTIKLHPQILADDDYRDNLDWETYQ